MTNLEQFNSIYQKVLAIAKGAHYHNYEPELNQLKDLLVVLEKEVSELQYAVLTTKYELLIPLVDLYNKNYAYKHQIKALEVKTCDGNKDQYDVSTVTREASPLAGKNIIFLGSSVTYGAASMAQSFVEFIAAKTGLNYVKEAVSGTTLVDDPSPMGPSYIARMLKLDKDIKADLLLCQLSTNDATANKPLGTISESFDLADFDTRTITGAIEYIIAYTKKTWGCKTAFYTGSKYDSPAYNAMVDRMYEIAKKWDIDIIDLWYDEKLNNVTKEQYSLYMSDPIHPTKAGYKVWWSPKIQKGLEEILSK